MNRLIVASLMAVGVLALRAADIDFPNLDQSGDLMSADAWGRDVPTVDAARITAGGTYVASTNGMLGGLTIGSASKMVFDLTNGDEEDTTITMAGPVKLSATNRKVEFKGGTWDLQGLYGFSMGAWGDLNGNRVTFNGCVITNVSSAYLYYGSATATGYWTLTNSANVFVKGRFEPAFNSVGTMDVVINSGSTLSLGNGFTLGRQDSAKVGTVFHHAIHVSGCGSRFTSVADSGSSTFSVGESAGTGSVMEVLDGAAASFSGGWGGILGNAATSNSNVLRVAGCGSKMSIGTLYINKNGGFGNRLEAYDHGTATVYKVFLNGMDAQIVASNAVISCSDGIAWASGSDHVIRLSGNCPRISLANGYSFKNRTQLVFDLDPNGYLDENVAPFYSAAWGSGDGTEEIIVTGIEEMQKRMVEQRIRRREMKLAFVPSAAWATTEAFARWNAHLPEGAELYWSLGYICLRVNVKFGIMLIVR